MKRCLSVFLSLVLFINSYSQADTVQKMISGRKNSPEQQQKPYVILISADGFRYDYARKYRAKYLSEQAAKGVSAESMIPSFPSITFPNHYTLVTGLYPAHHGLVNNYFYDAGKQKMFSMRNAETVRDGSWYGGIPLWVLAEEQQMLAACFYWVGSEAKIRGILPTYYYTYNENIPIDRRIEIVTDWLKLPAEKRPHLITFYFPETDHAGHDYGPEDNRTGRVVRWLDSAIQKLAAAVKTTGLPVNFIFVSDHGMTSIDTVNTLKMPATVDTANFIIPRGFEVIGLYAKKGENILPTYNKLKKEENGFKVYLKKEIPPWLHYGEKDDRMNRVGDILLLAEWPRVFNFSARAPKPGAHGFDPRRVKDMESVFMAWGPSFKSGIKTRKFENVHIYPLVTTILGLTYNHTIDGSPILAKRILK